ncbi:hypothetical protein BHE74_00029524 [Ensete ventricosum]|nr:hypothetical protein BHE74_00029524 [Ensete ventricosum]
MTPPSSSSTASAPTPRVLCVFSSFARLPLRPIPVLSTLNRTCSRRCGGGGGGKDSGDPGNGERRDWRKRREEEKVMGCRQHRWLATTRGRRRLQRQRGRDCRKMRGQA